MAKRLPAAGAVEPVEIGQIVIRTLQAERGIGEDRKEGDDPGADQLGRMGVVDIDQDQRRDGDDRRDLQDHREGIKTALDPGREVEQHRQADTADDGDEEGGKGDPKRHQKRVKERIPILDQALQDEAGAGQDVMRDIIQADDHVPGDQNETADHGWKDDAQISFLHAVIACCKAPDTVRQ